MVQQGTANSFHQTVKLHAFSGFLGKTSGSFRRMGEESDSESTLTLGADDIMARSFTPIH